MLALLGLATGETILFLVGVIAGLILLIFAIFMLLDDTPEGLLILIIAVFIGIMLPVGAFEGNDSRVETKEAKEQISSDPNIEVLELSVSEQKITYTDNGIYCKGIIIKSQDKYIVVDPLCAANTDR